MAGLASSETDEEKMDRRRVQKTQNTVESWYSIDATKLTEHGRLLVRINDSPPEPQPTSITNMLNNIVLYYPQPPGSKISMMIYTKDTSTISIQEKQKCAQSVSEFMKQYEHEHIAALGTTAVVITNPLINILLRIAFAIRPPKTNVRLCSSVQSGMQLLGWK
jgi:hypothetical protein